MVNKLLGQPRNTGVIEQYPKGYLLNCLKQMLYKNLLYLSNVSSATIDYTPQWIFTAYYSTVFQWSHFVTSHVMLLIAAEPYLKHIYCIMTTKAYCCLINRSHRLYLRAVEMLSKYIIVGTDCGHCSSVFTTVKSTLGNGDENASDESDCGDDEGDIAEAGKKHRKPKKHGKDGSLDGNKEQFTPAQMDSFEVLEFLL